MTKTITAITSLIDHDDQYLEVLWDMKYYCQQSSKYPRETEECRYVSCITKIVDEDKKDVTAHYMAGKLDAIEEKLLSDVDGLDVNDISVMRDVLTESKQKNEKAVTWVMEALSSIFKTKTA